MVLIRGSHPGPKGMTAWQKPSADVVECLTNACTTVLKMCACAAIMNKI